MQRYSRLIQPYLVFLRHIKNSSIFRNILLQAKYLFLITAYIVKKNTKKLLKSSAFFDKFEIISPFANRGGIEGIFLLLKNQFDIFQYVLIGVLGLLSFVLNSLINFSLAAKIISMHLFDPFISLDPCRS